MRHIGMTQWIVGDEPLEVSCQRLHACGYDGIEFAAEPDSLDVEECLMLMEKYNLNCLSLCGIFNETRDLTSSGSTGENAVRYIKKSVDFAVAVGAKVIIAVPSPVGRTAQPQGTSLEELTENTIHNLRLGADYAQSKGVSIAIEAINRYETYFANTLDKAYDLVQRVNHPAVGIMADLFHMSIEERSFTESLKKISDKLLHVHVADNTREPAGFGHTDFKEILLTLDQLGYEGSLTMEFMYRVADPYSATGMETQTKLMDCYAKQAIDYIRMIERSIQQ